MTTHTFTVNGTICKECLSSVHLSSLFLFFIWRLLTNEEKWKEKKEKVDSCLFVFSCYFIYLFSFSNDDLIEFRPRNNINGGRVLPITLCSRPFSFNSLDGGLWCTQITTIVHVPWPLPNYQHLPFSLCAVYIVCLSLDQNEQPV